ncbi:PP2C family protein-serine/threonine phosphatase [Candidatus Mycoplasma pogonae]
MKFFAATDIGTIREQNQDAWKILDNKVFTIGVLCDGMGGHKFGALASRFATQAFEWLFYNVALKKDDVKNVEKWFSQGVDQALKLMKKSAQDDVNKLDMGTTLVAFLKFHDSNKCYFFNIGDSRAYISNLQKIKQVTIDHNRLNYQIRYEGLTSEEATKDPYKDLITSSLGPSKKLFPELFVLQNSPQYVFLTTDGVHDFITNDAVQIILDKRTSLKNKTNQIIKLALSNGSDDNLSILLFRLDK